MLQVILASIIILVCAFPIVNIPIGYMLGKRKIGTILMTGILVCLLPAVLSVSAVVLLKDKIYLAACICSVLSVITYISSVLIGKMHANKQKVVLGKWKAPILTVLVLTLLICMVGGVVWTKAFPGYMDRKIERIGIVYWNHDLDKNPMPETKTIKADELKNHKELSVKAKELAKTGKIAFDSTDPYIGRYLAADVSEYTLEDIQNEEIFYRICLAKTIVYDYFETFDAVTATMNENEKAAYTEQLLGVIKTISDESSEIGRKHLLKRASYGIVEDVYRSVADYLAENADTYCCYDELFRRELQKLYPIFGAKDLVSSETAREQWKKAKELREYYLADATAKEALDKVY